METLRITASEITLSHYYSHNHTVGVVRAFDDCVYFVDASYYAASLFDRGFITVSFDY